MPTIGYYIYELQGILQELQQKLLAQEKKNKAQVDQVRRSSDIYIGDQVLLSTKHLRLKDKLGKLYPIF